VPQVKLHGASIHRQIYIVIFVLYLCELANGLPFFDGLYVWLEIGSWRRPVVTFRCTFVVDFVWWNVDWISVTAWIAGLDRFWSFVRITMMAVTRCASACTSTGARPCAVTGGHSAEKHAGITRVFWRRSPG